MLFRSENPNETYSQYSTVTKLLQPGEETDERYKCYCSWTNLSPEAMGKILEEFKSTGTKVTWKLPHFSRVARLNGEPMIIYASSPEMQKQVATICQKNLGSNQVRLGEDRICPFRGVMASNDRIDAEALDRGLLPPSIAPASMYPKMAPKPAVAAPTPTPASEAPTQPPFKAPPPKVSETPTVPALSLRTNDGSLLVPSGTIIGRGTFKGSDNSVSREQLVVYKHRDVWYILPLSDTITFLDKIPLSKWSHRISLNQKLQFGNRSEEHHV